MSGPTGSREAPGPRRGQIWEIDLDPRRGREQMKGRRPCLVVSTESLNLSRFGRIIVCPVTTRERRSFRWRPSVMPADLAVEDPSWEAKPHWVATDRIVTVDRDARAIRHLATIANPERVTEIDASLRMMLALR